jgi:hypothetical protein
MQDNLGNLLFDVSGTVRLAGTGTLATIYGDAALTVPIANPMTNHPSFGSFKCYLGSGSYDFYMAKSGYTFETLTGLQGWGTMALQNANAVAITGGSATFGAADTGTTRTGPLGVQRAAAATAGIYVHHAKGSQHGIVVQPTDSDAAGLGAITFLNLAGGGVGGIVTTATTTTYGTTSDARLKHAITTLIGELAVIRALRPVRFRWLVDDSEGVGFLAQEVAEHVQGVVTGQVDEVNPDGSIRPQMIDLSKLVPWLVGAVQTLAGQVETLTERVTELEAGG